MKINKYSAVLAALGVVSMASVSQAASYIYFTGSTAARGNIYAALTAAPNVVGGVNQGGEGLTELTGHGSGGSTMVFHGNLVGNGDEVYVIATWTGSEAGIASVAGQNLYQVLPLDTTQPDGSGSTLNGGLGYLLPGTGSGLQFVVLPANGGAADYSTLQALPITGQGAQTSPDIAMADTSQAVSFTPASRFPLTEFGAVAVVPFTFMKGYNSAPDSSWTDTMNITTPGANVLATIGTGKTASFINGVAADTDPIGLNGRNFGSGTRMNFLLSGCLLPSTTTVKQFAWDGDNSGTVDQLYPAAASVQGVLTFPAVAAPYAQPQKLVAIGNDGYDSGGFVGKTMNVDQTGSGKVLLGYLGIGDANNAGPQGGAKNNGQPGTFLTYNGNYESDTSVEDGDYTFWGYEHIYGATTASSPDATQFGTDLKTALANNIATLGAASADIRTVAQSSLIPLTKMKVKRGVAPNYSDSGFPR